MKRIWVIVNPIAGGKRKESLADAIAARLSSAEVRIVFTQAVKHATELAREALKEQAGCVVVVGGDGTVNEAGQALIGTHVPLAIIPTGSGNGLARHLKIPLDPLQAIDVIQTGSTQSIDTVKINNRAYLGVAGIGFDAEVGWSFAQAGQRGFFTYFLSALKKLPGYRSSEYELHLDGCKVSKQAFLISFANSSQFGNGAAISPEAQIDDGLLDVVIVNRFPLYASAQILYQLFRNTLHRSRYVEIIRCKAVEIKQPYLKAHIDGEPIFFPQGVHIQIVPSSLKVMLPKT